MASRSWNRVELIGNLTRDPELRYTPNGAAVCTFGLATNRTFVSDGEKREEVDFHRLVSWNKLAELCNQLLKKGMRVFVSGRLQTRSWESQDGQTRNVTEIVIEDMIILTPKQSGDNVLVTADEINVAPVSLPPQEEVAAKPKEEKNQDADKKQVKKEDHDDQNGDGEKDKVNKPSENIEDKDLPF